MSETPLKPIETGVSESSAHVLPPKQPRRKDLQISQMMAYRGAVSPPGMVREYEKIIPGSANRFLQMAEREQQRRIDNDKAGASIVLVQEDNT